LNYVTDESAPVLSRSVDVAPRLNIEGLDGPTIVVLEHQLDAISTARLKTGAE
jgi:hypothetical protein